MRAIQRRSGVVIIGDPGVGKTHLARHVAHALGATESASNHRFVNALEHDGIDAWDASTWQASNDSLTETPIVEVEDVDALSERSTHALARACRSGAVRLVATTHRIPSGLAPLVRDGIVGVVRLAALGHGDAGAVVRAHLDGTVSADVIWWAWQTSAGNPRHLLDLIDAGVAGGHIVRVGTLWLLIGRPSPSTGMLELVEAELDGLDQARRDVVDTVALAGAVPLALLLKAVNPLALDDQISQGRLVESSDATSGEALVMPRHHRFGELAGVLVPPARRRDLFDRLLDADDLPATPTVLLVSATHWAVSCGIAVSPRSLLRASRAASDLGRLEVAMQLTTLVLSHPDALAEERIEALLVRCEGHRMAGRDAEAALDANAAQAEVESADFGGEHYCTWGFAVAVTRANLAQFGRGDVEGALDVISGHFTRVAGRLAAQSTAEEPQLPEALVDQADADRLMRLAYAGRFGDVIAMGANTEPAESLPAPQRVEQLFSLTFSKAYQGALEDALEDAKHLVSATTALGRSAPWGMMQTQSLAFLLLIWTGQIDVAAELIDGIDTDPSAPGFVDPAVRQLGRGRLACTRRDWNRAEEECAAAVARFQLVDFSGWLPMALTWLATAQAAAGNTADAAKSLEEARSMPLRASGIVAYDLWDHWCRVSITLGSVDARRVATSLVEAGRDQHLALIELWGWHLLAIIDAEAPGTEGLGRLGTIECRIQGALPIARLGHARALLGGDTAMIAAHYASLTRLGYWVPSPPSGSMAALTRRQLEIARLAASGLSSHQIAERLFISKRTVDTHLTHIYDRLGVRRRGELAVVLSAAAPDSGPG